MCETDHAGMPVMLLRHSDGKMRRDGSSAAGAHHHRPVDERGRVHGVPGLSSGVEAAVAVWITVGCRSREERRRWVKYQKIPDRLRGQDKAGFPASGTSFLSFCLHIVLGRSPTFRRDERAAVFPIIILFQCP